MKKSGFTLVELLAVIVILAVLMVFAVPNVWKVVTSSKTGINTLNLSGLNDAAVTYGLANIYIPDNCALTSIPTSDAVTMPSGCDKKTVTVGYLINNGYYKDEANHCKNTLNTNILIYKLKESNVDSVTHQIVVSYNIKALVPTTACQD